MTTSSTSPTATDIPSAGQLMAPLEFTRADLEANRGGHLGDNQRERLQRLQRRALLVGSAGFVAFALSATTFIYFGQINNSLILSLIGMFLTLLNALFVGIFGRQWMRLQSDLRANSVEVISGTLERVVKASGRANNFMLRVDDSEFYVTKETFNLFRHGQPYHFYRAAHSQVLLAAEPDV
jgi:hypothetical protein